MAHLRADLCDSEETHHILEPHVVLWQPINIADEIANPQNPVLPQRVSVPVTLMCAYRVLMLGTLAANDCTTELLTLGRETSHSLSLNLEYWNSCPFCHDHSDWDRE